MNTSPLFQTGLYLAVLLVLAWPMGRYLAAVLDGDLSTRFKRLAGFEALLCRAIGVKPEEDMPWYRYAVAIVAFNFAGLLGVYLLQRFQAVLPLNPAGLPAVGPDSAFNTAISFVTNTNWQGYSGEVTMSHLTQMLALTVQNFVSAATGIAVAAALVRGFSRKQLEGIGNAWLDLARVTLYLLLPFSVLFALVLTAQGVPQNFKAFEKADLLEHIHESNSDSMHENRVVTSQTIAMGPIASQEAIKMLGTNGGGFFNANSAHPFENPTPLANFLQTLSIFLIPAALCFAFGQWIGDRRQGFSILAAMILLFVLLLGAAFWAENRDNPILTQVGAAADAGNLEGKEVRFGSVSSILFAVITTSASCGAVNSMHDSYLPLGGGVLLLLIQLGEVVFGGVGAGLYGMLVFAILAVFLSGLMIGRTPEYLGKKIESFEMKMISISILITPLLVLGGSALAVATEAGLAGLANPAAHGFSEILYAFSSAANNNGSAFAGLSANTPFYNTLLGLAMWIGRFGVIIPVLAVAGNLSKKPGLSGGVGAMPTNGPLFIVILVSTVLLVGALTYIPALALGPIVEHLQLFHR